jgi:hypothetical protein
MADRYKEHFSLSSTPNFAYDGTIGQSPLGMNREVKFSPGKMRKAWLIPGSESELFAHQDHGDPVGNHAGFHDRELAAYPMGRETMRLLTESL